MAETKTRVVEVAVVIALASAGVFATIGVYEGQQPNRSAAGWFTAAAAALIVAVLIPIVVFGVFPLIERVGERRDAEATTSPAEPPLSPPPLPEPEDPTPVSTQPPDERIIVNVTPKFLADFYEGHMDFEGDASVSRFLGKWMPVSGPLSNVSDSRDASGSRWLGVYLDRPSGDPVLSLYFSDAKWFDRLLTLTRGDPVSALGRIVKADRHSVWLDDCELVDE